MSVQVQIDDGPLAPPGPWAPEGAGAVLCFEGVVRPKEGEERIEALDYTAYEPMAGAQLTQLALRAVERHGLIAVIVEHSRGRVPAGRCSFRLRVASRHRKEGLAAADWFIDEMKRDVPIWKAPVTAADAAGDEAAARAEARA